MPFSHIAGNEPIKKYLMRMVENRVVANSLLFAGKDKTKDLFAEAFARVLLNDHGDWNAKITHPDFYECRPEGKVGMHSIDALRGFNDEVYLTPHQAGRKVFIIYEAERMLPYSANALLKTFEEPPSWSVIILLSANIEAILPTILSRCRMLRISSTQNIQNAEKPLYEAVIRSLAKGKISSYGQLIEEAASLASQVESNKKNAEENIRAEILKNALQDLTSVQKQSVEKEVEGAVTMRAAEDMHAIFDAVQAWYRDIQLLQAKGDPKYLLNPEYYKELEAAIKSGGAIPLEVVQHSLAQAKLGFERSTSIAHVLENLFLKIR